MNIKSLFQGHGVLCLLIYNIQLAFQDKVIIHYLKTKFNTIFFQDNKMGFLVISDSCFIVIIMDCFEKKLC